MDQHLIALWDYTAVGKLELSFTEGTRIRLLKKHNDDWWEGEIDGVVGLFPANRTRPETSMMGSSTQSTNTARPNLIKSDVPPLGNYAGVQTRGGSSDYISRVPTSGMALMGPSAEGTSAKDDDIATKLIKLNLSNDKNKSLPSKPVKLPVLTDLELDRIPPKAIQEQGFVQMKVEAQKDEGGKLSPWKAYYTAIYSGFLLFYKGSYTKNKTLERPVIPVGVIDLINCQAHYATKSDTRRKHTFIIAMTTNIRLYLQLEYDGECTKWLEAVSLAVSNRNEEKYEEDTLRILQQIANDTSQLELNRMIVPEDGDRSKLALNTDKKGRRKIRSYFFGKPPRQDDNIESTDIRTVSSISPVFGGVLFVDTEHNIPRVVQLCVEEVERRGLDSIGIYRISGPTTTIQRYRQLFNQGDRQINLQEEDDVNVLTGLLKLYFRELKEPLMTFDLYDSFMDAARIPDDKQRMTQIRSLVRTLPDLNYHVLEYLVRHLYCVTRYSIENKMEATNLALIFSVGLLRPAQDDMSNILNTSLQTKVLVSMIQQPDWFFTADIRTQ